MKNDLTQDSIARTLVAFAVPFLIANILQSLYGTVDLFVIGQFCAAESVAAVSTGTQVTQIVTSLVTGLTLGSTILIGEYTGSKNYKMVKKDHRYNTNSFCHRGSYNFHSHAGF